MGVVRDRRTDAAFHDTDGHSTNWVVDSLGRPTQTQVCTATSGWTCTGHWLVSNETWDVANNLATEVDPRGNETDYLYDPMGNTTAVGEPVTATRRARSSRRGFRLRRIQQRCRVLRRNGDARGQWRLDAGIATSISPRRSCASHTRVVPHWQRDVFISELRAVRRADVDDDADGIHADDSYAPGSKEVTITAFRPRSPATFHAARRIVDTPAQSFWYDAYGNLRCYSKGQGTSVLSYDALGRMTSVADPDDSSANATSLCGKSTGQSGWNTQTTYTYFPDGALQSSQSPPERAGGSRPRSPTTWTATRLARRITTAARPARARAALRRNGTTAPTASSRSAEPHDPSELLLLPLADALLVRSDSAAVAVTFQRRQLPRVRQPVQDPGVGCRAKRSRPSDLD